MITSGTTGTCAVKLIAERIAAIADAENVATNESHGYTKNAGNCVKEDSKQESTNKVIQALPLELKDCR